MPQQLAVSGGAVSATVSTDSGVGYQADYFVGFDYGYCAGRQSGWSEGLEYARAWGDGGACRGGSGCAASNAGVKDFAGG